MDKKMRMMRLSFIFFVFVLLIGCAPEEKVTGESETENGLKQVSFVLDWTPNTNHTGIYVAKELGYFEDVGLDVDILLPGKVDANQLMATGKVDFGIGFQEHVTIAREEGLPIVSVAAIIQHNTAGYASAVEHDITEPIDFEGKSFGGVGHDLESAMMQTIMDENGADYDKVDMQNIGDADIFTVLQQDIDFALIFQGWTGIEAELREQDLNMVYLKDFSESLDFYTPLIATSEALIEEEPETVKDFVQAAVKGYEYAIENPEEAADILIESEPDIDGELVEQSQKWLSTKYQDDAEQFGIQELERWETLKNFMVEHDIIEGDLEISDAFTNEFLPNS